MRRILSCVFFAIMTAAPLSSAQNPASQLASLEELSDRNQLPQLIQAANSLLASGNLKPLDRSMALTFLGHAYQQSGDAHAAIGYYEKALAILDHDGSHPPEYALTLGAMATLYAQAGQPDTAKHLLLRSVHLLEKDGTNHSLIAWLWNDLATVAANQNSGREARKCMAHALAESRLDPNFSSDSTSAFLTTQARIAEVDHDLHTAIADYQQALALWKQSHDDQHPKTAWLYVLLGSAYLQAGDLASARETVSRGWNLMQTSSAPQSPNYLEAELAYAKVLDAAGSHDEASKLRNQAQTTANANTQPSKGEVSVFALR